jgi:hypothetical protein
VTQRVIASAKLLYCLYYILGNNISDEQNNKK